jgi:hypothetical protein
MALLLIEELRAALIAEGLVRRPPVAGPLPPMFLHPREGVPAPGAGRAPERDADLVTGLFMTGGTAARPYVEWLEEQRTVDVRYRSRQASTAERLARKIEAALSGRRHWLMGQLLVEQALVWRPLGLVVSDDLGYDFVQSFAFDVRRAAYEAA